MDNLDNFAILRILVSIEGTGASNTPHLKRVNGGLLTKALTRIIPIPCCVCPGMHISMNDGVYKISGVEWRIANKQGALILHTDWGIWYHDQGPDELQGREKVEKFFDDYVASMLSLGWEVEF